MPRNPYSNHVEIALPQTSAYRAAHEPLPNQTIFSEVDTETVKAALRSGEEFALFDVRDESDYATGHILYAAHLPYGRVEVAVLSLVPRKDTRIVLTDNGEGLAEKVARILIDAGYTDVSLLEGRNSGWTDRGYALFTGRNVPAIGFYEVVEHQRSTPNITATDLKSRLDRGEDVIVLDTRPREEFEALHIPGALNAPGSEVLHRLGALDIKPDTLVVTNCAGRTRSILGAQSLIDAGVTNPVASLTGGTMEWLIAGYDLAYGVGDTAGFANDEKLAATRQLADALAERNGVQVIDFAKLQEFRAEKGRTLFQFDVRSPEEYRAGHPEGFRHAAGGQLSSGAERFAGVRNARIVLFDAAGIRSRLGASWLVQLGGYEVYVLDGPVSGPWLSGSGDRPVITVGALAPYVQAASLQKNAAEYAVYDVSSSNAFRKGHVPGARYVRRDELDRAVLAEDRAVVLISEDGSLAQAIAARLRELTGKNVRALVDGTKGWKDAGLALDSGGIGTEDGADLPDKYALAPERRNALFRDYLGWEVSLVELLSQDPDAQATFRLPTSH